MLCCSVVPPPSSSVWLAPFSNSVLVLFTGPISSVTWSSVSLSPKSSPTAPLVRSIVPDVALADDFTVVSEVGFKDPVRSEQLPPSMWVEFIKEDLEAGASLVTLEARESGRSGICRPDGALRFGLIEDVLVSGISQQSLLFEAPTTALQTHMITRIGPNVNLGNVPAAGVIGLETLRLGLRADTLMAFEN